MTNSINSIKNILLLIIFFIVFIRAVLFASEKELIDLAEYYNEKGEYYNAVTEIMRYQYIYPAGDYFPQSMLILGTAYYKGGNYSKAVSALTVCYENYKNKPEGERALYGIGYVQLYMSSPFFALRTFQEYNYIYPDGRYKEQVARDMCYTLTLMKDLTGAKEAVSDYEKNYTEGKYLRELKEFSVLIDDEMNRPRKNVWVSVLGSVVLPGFGHFYTGKYGTGLLSFFSNALCIFLFYDAYQDNSKLRMIVFGAAELSFYNYSLYSSVRNVYEYNNNREFYKSVYLRLSRDF